MKFAARCALVLGYAVSAVALTGVDVTDVGAFKDGASLAEEQQPAVVPTMAGVVVTSADSLERVAPDRP